MKPGRYTKLKSYLEATYYHGHIRWLLMKENGQSIYCDRCGNIANGVVQIKTAIGNFNIPFCKVHISEIDPKVKYAPFFIIHQRPNRKTLKEFCGSPKLEIISFKNNNIQWKIPE